MNDEDDKVTAKTAKSDGPSKKPKTNVASKMKGKRKLVVPKEEQEDDRAGGEVGRRAGGRDRRVALFD